MMKNKITFSFIENIDEKMNLAGVELEINFIKRNDKKRGNEIVEFPYIETEYKYAIQFGADYFLDHYSRDNDIDINIKLVRTREMLMDTNSAMITYSTIMALSIFFNYEIEGLYLDKVAGLLILPIPKKRG